MQANEFSSYSSYLDEVFSKMVRNFNKIQLDDYSNDTLKKSNDLFKQGSTLLNTLKSHVKSLETLLIDCSNFTEEIEDDITCAPKTDEFVFQTKNGMLGYPGKEFIAKILKKNAATAPVANQAPAVQALAHVRAPEPKKEEKILIQEIGYSLKITTVANIETIPPAIHYYKNTGLGDKYPSGFYMRMPNNTIVRVPVPEVVDSKKEYDRKHSIRCKHHSKDECDSQRQKMAKIYNSTVRSCNFAHKGDKLVKIGYTSRCPSVPSFGNPHTMSQDIKYINLDDIKNVLMYGLSDLFTAAIWLDYNAAGGYGAGEFLSLDSC